MTLQLDTEFLISSFIWYHHVISIELPREQAKRQEMKSMLCLCTGCYFISMGTTDVAVNLIYERVTTKKATDEGVHSRRHPQFSPQPYLCLTRKESSFLMKNTLSCSCNQRSIYKHGINFHDENKANKNHFIRAKKAGVLLIRSVNYDDQKVLLVADIFTIHFIVFTVSLKHLIMFGIHTLLFFVHGKVCYPNYVPSFCMLLVQFSRIAKAKSLTHHCILNDLVGWLLWWAIIDYSKNSTGIFSPIKPF